MIVRPQGLGFILPILVLAGCGSSAPAASPSSAPASSVVGSPAANAKPSAATSSAVPASAKPSAATSAATGGSTLKLYMVNSVTGNTAAFGINAVNGSTLAAKDINDAGGLKDSCGNTSRVDLTTWDMAASQEQAIAGMRKAADDASVLGVIGSTPSFGYASMVPASAQLKLPIISPGATADIQQWSPYAFRVTLTNDQGFPQLYKVLQQKFSMKRLAVLYDITTDAAKTANDLTKTLAPKLGFEVVNSASFRQGDTDFRPQLTTVGAANPDWALLSASNPEFVKLVDQMDQLGMLDKVKITASQTLFDPQLWDLTKGKIKGSVGWTANIDFGSNDPAIKKFVTSYKSMFSQDPTIFSVYGYQSMQAVADAVKRACTVTDRQKFRDALSTTNIDALGGKVVFNSPSNAPNGENSGAAAVVQQVTGRGTADVLK